MPDIMGYITPLSGSAHNNRAFQWTPLLDKCFESIKALATKAPILKPVDFSNNEPVWVITNNSKIGLVQCMDKTKTGNIVAQPDFYLRNFQMHNIIIVRMNMRPLQF